MKARLTQLIARLLMPIFVGIAVWLGATDDQQQTAAEFAGMLASGVVALGAFIVDLLIHKAETGGVTKPAGTQKTPQDSSHMLRSWALPVLLLTVLLMGGCSNPLLPAANLVDQTILPEYRQQVQLAPTALTDDDRVLAADAIENTETLTRDTRDQLIQLLLETPAYSVAEKSVRIANADSFSAAVRAAGSETPGLNLPPPTPIPPIE